jgi:hypothetical protein
LGEKKNDAARREARKKRVLHTAIPQLLPRFLDIQMYPDSPHEVPQELVHSSIHEAEEEEREKSGKEI